MLIVYGILALFLVGGIGMAYHTITAGAVTSYKAQVAEQEKIIDEQNAVAVKEANTKIADMQAAFDAGKEKAAVVEKKVYVRAQADVARYPVFQNPACVLPAESLALLNAARAGLRTADVDALLVVPSNVAPVASTPPVRAPASSMPMMPAPPAAVIGAAPHPKPRPVGK